MRRWMLVLVAVCLIGMCMAEPHIVDADEWNTTVRDLVEGDDPRQPASDESEDVSGTPWLLYGAVAACGLFALVAVIGWQRRAKR